ncbi:hypothetical protein [Candidatus Chlorohelix sp.]|uniref:hypothetical protein n=1 Tax=Candidatus Chlorohelix sp. TaxID=3139201 RepID=UPI0030652D16
MKLISEENRAFLIKRFADELKDPVTIELYTLGSYHTSAEEIKDNGEEFEVVEEEACRITRQLLTELSEVSEGKIRFVLHDMETPEGEATANLEGIQPGMLPALAYKAATLKGKSHYYGMPSGYEFGTLVENLISLSGGKAELSQKAQEQVEQMSQPVSLLIFVTPT